VAAVWNDRVYIPDAGFIGPLDHDTLNSLKDDSHFEGAKNMVFLTYNYEDDVQNIEADDEENSEHESIDNYL
jgi:hypothetical protein